MLKYKMLLVGLLAAGTLASLAPAITGTTSDTAITVSAQAGTTALTAPVDTPWS